MYEDWKILKTDLAEKQEEYSEVANWCNENSYHIEDDGTYYKVVENHAPTEEEQKMQVREVRDNYLQKYDFTQLPDTPFTSEEKLKYAQYRQHLRDYTKEENWWLSHPKDFNSWRENNE